MRKVFSWKSSLFSANFVYLLINVSVKFKSEICSVFGTILLKNKRCRTGKYGGAARSDFWIIFDRKTKKLFENSNLFKTWYKFEIYKIFNEFFENDFLFEVINKTPFLQRPTRLRDFQFCFDFATAENVLFLFVFNKFR